MIRLLQTKKDIISNCFTAVLCLFITLLPIKASCQKQANVWYFGDHAGLDFKTGSPVALSNGALKTDEGCASISDTAGNILFYTDGITVYNKKDTSMPNGTGLNGHSSSTQSSIIIPVPGNDSIFYIFTTDAQGGANGCEYSRVNMHKNGGHGDVISKNKMLFTPSAEKITAIRNNNGSDIWVIGHKHNTDTFYTYKIDNKGINSSVVKSKSGSSYSTKSGVIGYMKASPDGKKLALAISSTNTVEVFDFDDKSGVVSNCRSMTDNTNFSGVYGHFRCCSTRNRNCQSGPPFLHSILLWESGYSGQEFLPWRYYPVQSFRISKCRFNSMEFRR